MRRFDAAVIGGGILGCFAARNLMRWNISTVLMEEKDDICTGVTRSNTAIVYPGYDNKPGSLKAAMTVKGNAEFDSLCEELDVSFSRCGSLMVSFGPAGDRILRKKLEQGQHNGVLDLKLISGEEAAAMEPLLAPGVTLALYAPSTGTVNPWQLGIAAYENAVHNGCVSMLGTRVLNIHKTGRTYVIETDQEPIECKVILNCGGLSADKIQEFLFPPSVRLFPDGADYFILDKHAASPRHIIFHESEEKGKGITAVPTVEGSLLLGPTRRPLENHLLPGFTHRPLGGNSFATTESGMKDLRQSAAQVLPGIDLNQIIRSFGAVRPHPHRVVQKDGAYIPDGRSIGDFVIENPAPGFFSLIGVKTPGLTCSDQLGRHLAKKAATYLDASVNPGFHAGRKAITLVHGLDFESRAALAGQNPDYADIICQCEDISKAEILEAIRRGAVTVDGVKRRVGAGMGRCQGSRCSHAIAELLGDSV